LRIRSWRRRWRHQSDNAASSAIRRADETGSRRKAAGWAARSPADRQVPCPPRPSPPAPTACRHWPARPIHQKPRPGRVRPPRAAPRLPKGDWGRLSIDNSTEGQCNGRNGAERGRLGAPKARSGAYSARNRAANPRIRAPKARSGAQMRANGQFLTAHVFDCIGQSRYVGGKGRNWPLTHGLISVRVDRSRSTRPQAPGGRIRARPRSVCMELQMHFHANRESRSRAGYEGKIHVWS